MTCRLQEVRPRAPIALAAWMARFIALTAPTPLRLFGAAFHEPFHANGRQRSMAVTWRSDLTAEAAPQLDDPFDRTVEQIIALPNRAVFDQARRLRRSRPGVSARALPLRGPRGARRATCARAVRINAAESGERLCGVVARVDAVLAQDGPELVQLGVQPAQLPGQRHLAGSGSLQPPLPR